MRVVSGIQPSGILHLGNYFGAIKQHVDLQDIHECYYFIADFHALTTIHDPEKLKRFTFEVAAAYLALGLNPDRAVLFRQSDVPEVCELAWLLSTVTGKGLLERAHAVKDREAKGRPISMGLFCYPLLMAADILIYGGELVPVGRDQLQHIEMAQDIAGYFNSIYSQNKLFSRPEPLLTKTPTVPGTDGLKMSKSRGNIIGIFDDSKLAAERFMSIKTDSRLPEEPKDPTTDTLFNLLSLFAPSDELAIWRFRYQQGGFTYREIKSRLIELFELRFSAFRDTHNQWLNRPHDIDDILKHGQCQARPLAKKILSEAEAACGIARAN